MTRAQDWTIEEFEILVGHIDLQSKEFAKLLPRRTSDAIEVVRQGIHRFHDSGDGSMLSDIMRQRITEKGRSLFCPICRQKL